MTPGLCSVCLKPCIALCPACRQSVHYGYGHDNDNCSGRHESTCAGARASRELPVEPRIDAPPRTSSSRKPRRVKRRKKRRS